MIAASGSLRELASQVDRRNLARLEPAVGGGPAVAGIDSQHQPARILPAHAAEPFRIRQRRRADHQSRQPEIEQLANRLLVANAAAELALDIDGRQNLLHARQIDRQAFARTLQIDDVQMLRALLGKLPGDVRRILREDGFLLIVALPEPDALSAPQINCRPDLHRKSFRRNADRAGPSEKWETQNMAHARPNGKCPERASTRKSCSRKRFRRVPLLAADQYLPKSWGRGSHCVQSSGASSARKRDAVARFKTSIRRSSSAAATRPTDSSPDETARRTDCRARRSNRTAASTPSRSRSPTHRAARHSTSARSKSAHRPRCHSKIGGRRRMRT